MGIKTLLISLLLLFGLRLLFKSLLSNVYLELFMPYIILLVVILSLHFSGLYRVEFFRKKANNFWLLLMVFSIVLMVTGGLGYFLNGLLGIQDKGMLNRAYSLQALIPLVTVAAFLEEIFFREIVLKSIDGFASSVLAVLVSSLVFSIFHLSKGQYISTFFIGIILAYIMLRYNDLKLVIGSHLLYNYLGLLLLIASRN